MILSNKSRSKTNQAASASASNFSNDSAFEHHQPIANSTMSHNSNRNNNNNNFYADTDQFFVDQQQQQQQQQQFGGYQPTNFYNNNATNQQQNINSRLSPSQQIGNNFYDPSKNNFSSNQSQLPNNQQGGGFMMNPNSNLMNNNFNPNPNQMYFNAPQQTSNGGNNNNKQFNNNFLPQQQQQQQQQPNAFYNPLPTNVNNLLSDPVASMAVKYGSTLADQGKEYVAQNVDRWFSISKLRFYFAVDTNYVAKKLFIILFPFLNKDWSIKYYHSDAAAVPPKLDVNAPDMYIPVMAFVTYILMVGLMLGTKDKFSPEQLGMHASSALGWLVIEVFIIFVTLQVLSIKSALKTFDIMAFCGYKYFGMIVALLGHLILPSNGYWVMLGYMCFSITYFMARNLKLLILSTNSDDQVPAPDANPYQQHQQQINSSLGNKRRVYVLLFISIIQPLFMWFLTRHLI